MVITLMLLNISSQNKLQLKRILSFYRYLLSKEEGNIHEWMIAIMLDNYL